jgi:hypothetical protein
MLPQALLKGGPSMEPHSLPPREHLLSLWVKDRLGEREAVEWAAMALKQTRGSLGKNTVLLFEFLDKHSGDSAELAAPFKKLWRLLRVSAQERGFVDGSHFVYEFKQAINHDTLRVEDIDTFIECIRPRLEATELSSYAKSHQGSTSDPLQWVHWGFDTALGFHYQGLAKLKHAELEKIPETLLSHILERGTSSLECALDFAREIGWIGPGRDLPNHLVHLVFRAEPVVDAPTDATSDNRDPDNLNHNFAPIVRLLSSAFFVLAERNHERARRAAEDWKNLTSGLFTRLFAFASWKPAVIPGQEVAEFLENVDSYAFWRWPVFPEIATLRALRWNDLPVDARSRIELRLLRGPDKSAFRSQEPIPEQTILFHRDHELARLVDAGLAVSAEFRREVNDRRNQDSNFPNHISPVEPGLPAPRVTHLPEGSPEKFDDVPDDELLVSLSETRSGFFQADHAEAFARTFGGKHRILKALAARSRTDKVAERAWRLLLSYPHEMSEDKDANRQLTESIANLAMGLTPDLLERLSGDFCYWLDGVEEKIPGFSGSDRLWAKLLPFAITDANARADADDQVDLTMAALNEPLGHLLSVFLRRCPSMPREENKRPSLPREFTTPLKGLFGRANELLANRMAVQMNYFMLADRRWLDEIVIRPMKEKDKPGSDRIWEAFAKFGPLPRSTVWNELEISIFGRLAAPRQSPEAKRRLAEMSVVVWVTSKEQNSGYQFDSLNFRSALGLSNDDVRGAVAWQFSTMFRRKHETEEGERPGEELWPRIGPTFFHEVWPLEPALQSTATANHFAQIPAGVGLKHFHSAVDTILPYLLPFQVWAVSTEFALDPNDSITSRIVRTFPQQTLMLLSACISGQQGNKVYGLKQILDWITAADETLQHDHRIRLLRRLALA